MVTQDHQCNNPHRFGIPTWLHLLMRSNEFERVEQFQHAHVSLEWMYVTLIDEHRSNANASRKLDEQPNTHPSQEPTPLSDQDRRESLLGQPANISSVIDAVSKSVEGAIRNILANGSLSLPKRNPRRRKIENEEVELQKQVELGEDRSFILVCRSTHCSKSRLH